MLKRVQSNLKRLNSSRSSSPQPPSLRHSSENSNKSDETPTKSRKSKDSAKRSLKRSKENLQISYSNLTEDNDQNDFKPIASEDSYSRENPQTEPSFNGSIISMPDERPVQPLTANQQTTQPPTFYLPNSTPSTTSKQPSNSNHPSTSSRPPSLVIDQVDGCLGDRFGFHGDRSGDRMSNQIEALKTKIFKIEEQIAVEQQQQDDYLQEFLTLTKRTSKQQMGKVRGVFDNKIKKHKDIIDKLLLKKKSYQERIKNLESGGRDPNRNPLRDGVSNLKDFSGGVVRSVASKPKDLALRIRNKFGSSDNITNDNSRTSETGDADPSRYLSDDVSSNSEIEPHGRSLHHGNGDKNARVRSWSQLNRGSPDYAEVREENNRLRQQLQLIMQNVMIIQSDVVEIKEAQARVNDSLERVQERAREDFLQVLTNFETEKIRSERVEHQVGTLVGFQESGLDRIKEEIRQSQDKFDYHLQERTRELQETVANCNQRLQEVESEHRNSIQQTSDKQGSGEYNEVTRKLFNVVMALLSLVLVLIAAGSNLLIKITQTKARIWSFTVFVVLLSVSIKFLPNILKHFELS